MPTTDLRPARRAATTRTRTGPVRQGRRPSARLPVPPGTDPGGRAAGPTARSGRPAHRPAGVKGGSYYLLVVLTVVLCLIGVVMVLSASSIVSLSSYGTPWHYFVRQWIWLLVGTGGFVLALRVDHERWRRPSRLIMYATMFLLFAVLVPGVGVRAYGASRWLGTSSVQIQPSEVAKLALVLFAADVLDRRAGRGRWMYQAGPVLAVLVLLVGLVMAQPDMGTTLVLVLIAVGMLFTAGLPARNMAALGGAGVVVLAIMAKAAPYRWRRIMSFTHPLKDAQNSGYQAAQGLYALSHGHLFGDGIGSSIASYGYLPNAQTDYIFAIIGEETGLVGGVFICGLFLTLMLVGVRIACRAPSRFAALVAAGITSWLVGQAVINIGAVVGVLPVTGVPLPFISFGGSALVISLFGAGLLANIAKQS
ncbi:MAG: putative lipid II flippase FtsW [Actinomycetota bacterium]|nr:putative lipid II flippase FtsW [Actinomycetota bacterium]